MSLNVNSLNMSEMYQDKNLDLSSLDIKLDEIDPYSLESLQSIMEERLKENLEFSVVAIKENGHFSFVEASSFLEQFLKGNTKNPFTNNSLKDFHFFTYDNQKKLFECKADKNGAQNPSFYLQVLYNDHRRSLEARLDYLHRLGCLSIKERPAIGYDYLIKAAQLGFGLSQKTLAFLFFKEDKKEEAIYWFKKYLEKHADSPADLMFLAAQIQEEDPSEAFSLFKKAALLGNYLAIANIIDFYEANRGVGRNLLKARAWRNKLPAEHREDSMTDYINYLKKINYNWNWKKV